MSDWRVVSDHGWPCWTKKEKIFPQYIIFLTTLMLEVALILSNSSVIIASRCFQPFGYLLSTIILVVLWKLGVIVFICLSGYISSPRRTRLGVGTYKCLAMLTSIVHTVYIDNACVPAEYLRTQEMQGQSLEERKYS